MECDALADLNSPPPLPFPHQESYGSTVDYFINCSYHTCSGRLFVLGGDHK